MGLVILQCQTKDMSELAATATAMARCLCHHTLRYKTSLATPLATVVAVAANSCMALDRPALTSVLLVSAYTDALFIDLHAYASNQH